MYDTVGKSSTIRYQSVTLLFNLSFICNWTFNFISKFGVRTPMIMIRGKTYNKLVYKGRPQVVGTILICDLKLTTNLSFFEHFFFLLKTCGGLRKVLGSFNPDERL